VGRLSQIAWGTSNDFQLGNAREGDNLLFTRRWPEVTRRDTEYRGSTGKTGLKKGVGNSMGPSAGQGTRERRRILRHSSLARSEELIARLSEAPQIGFQY